MEFDVARTPARRQANEGRVVRRQRGFVRIEAVGEHLIDAEIGHQHEAVIGRDDGAMRVGASLARRIHA